MKGEVDCRHIGILEMSIVQRDGNVGGGMATGIIVKKGTHEGMKEGFESPRRVLAIVAMIRVVTMNIVVIDIRERGLELNDLVDFVTRDTMYP
ncbi:hypothetical protein VNO78_14090 [Psophocarpus tetragonolobus]|uniref:Uncharacterized protein n=1 Tax=Psophocarpus tetragonolobus TaxID=3891 RepID=A0AAN9XQV4_PSOTE